MRRVFLIISFLCLLPFTTMAQTRSSSYDEKLEQLYGQSPLAKDGPKEMLNLGMKGQLDENYAYAFLIPEGNGGIGDRYTVTIRGLDLAQARALINNYPGSTMEEE